MCGRQSDSGAGFSVCILIFPGELLFHCGSIFMFIYVPPVLWVYSLRYSLHTASSTK